MNLLQYKNWLFNSFAVISLTVAMSYFVVNVNNSDKSESVSFLHLTNDDIDEILAVKTEMQEAKIQAELNK